MGRLIALVTGATGQDGFYLCEHLNTLGYEVHGVRRPIAGEREEQSGIIWHEIDLTDGAALSRLVSELKPREIYNLAAQSHVGKSFENPELTFNVNAMGVLRLLEAVRLHCRSARVYQASTSELFGSSPAPQNEGTKFYPRSPYGVAKLAAYWLGVNYREAYGLFVCNGILFNHESPRRGHEFVTRKITRAVAEFAAGRTEVLRLGNLEAKRDWGHARDYVRAMRLCLQQPVSYDYVIATGESRTVREFVEEAFACIGATLTWNGRGANERGYDGQGRLRVIVDPKLYRPSEVEDLRGDATRASRVLNWKPETPFTELVSEMVAMDMTA